MANVYASIDTGVERIDTAYQAADPNELATLLARLPADLSAITGLLSGEQMRACMALYKSHDDSIIDLVVRIRQLYFGNAGLF